MRDLYRDDHDNVVLLNGGPGRFDEPEPPWDDEYLPYEPDRFQDEPTFGYEDLGRLTIRIFAEDALLDTIHRPVDGSGYEREVLELRHPLPQVTPLPPPPPRHERELAWLARLVGGTDALDHLGTDPLPDAPLDLTTIRDDLRARVAAIGRRCDEVADQLRDPELRTACRRLLARAVTAEPALLLRSDRDDTAAGAVLVAVAKANDLVGAGKAIPASLLTHLCGLRSSPTDRAKAFAHAVSGPDGTGFARYGDSRDEPDVLVLGSPDLLLGRFRAKLLQLRGLAHEERHRAAG